MTITEVAIKRPSLIIVIFTILIGGGLLSYKQLSYQLLPDFSPPILTVTTPYPGASPSIVESQVSEPMEDALSGLENIKEVTSFSLENASLVLLEFNHSVDLETVMQDAQRKIEGINMQRKSAATPAAPAAFLSRKTTAKVVSALPKKESPLAAECICIFSH
jgi:HAE1 family hydrophobic/amphiphilic exporter-1